MKTHALRLIAFAALLTLPSPAANILHLADGRDMVFRAIRWDASNSQYLVQSAGGGDVMLAVARKTVERMEMDKPVEMAQAEQLVAANRSSEAISLLQTVMTNDVGLNWDNTARELLARIYVKGNESAKAVKIVDELIAANAPISSSLRVEYWKALLAVDPKSVKVVKDLSEAIATGPREIVPVAQNMRGDVLRAAGRKEEALEEYLRTILFFEDADGAWTDALTRASELYEALGDASRAGELRQKATKKQFNR